MTKKTCLDLHRDSVLVPISSFMKDSSCPFLNDLNENANGRGFCIVRSWGFDDGKMADPDTNDLTNLTRSESSQEPDGNGAFNESSSVELETIFVIPKYDDPEALPKDVEADLLKSYDDEESDENEAFHESDDDEESEEAFSFHESDDDEESDENEAFHESDDDEELDENEAFHESDDDEELDENEAFHESDQSEGFAESKKEDEDEKQEEYEDVFAPYLHLWDSCEKCETAHYKEHLIKEMNVCVNCGAHLKMNSSDRIGVLVDPTTFDPMDEKLNSIDAIEWDSEAVLYAWKIREKKLQKEWEFHEKEMKGFRDNFSFSWKPPKSEDSEEYWDLDLYDFYLKKFELKGKASGRSEDCLEGPKATERDSFREEILQMYPELLPDESEKALLEKLKELPDESQEELEARLEELELQRKSEEELLEKSQRDLLEKYHLLVEKSQQDLDLLEKSQQDLLEKYHQALDLLEKSRKEVLEKLETYRRVLAELSKDAVFKLTLKSIYRVFLEGYYREWVRHETGKFPEEQFKKDIEEEENSMEIEEEEIEEEGIEEEEIEEEEIEEEGIEEEGIEEEGIEEEEEKLRKMSKEKLVALLRIFSKFLARRPKFDKYKYKEIWKNVGFWVDDLIYAWAILEARQDLMNENWKKHFRFEGTDPFSFWFKLQDRQHFSSMTKEEEVFEYGMSWKEYRRRVLYKCTAIACWEKERNKELAKLKKDSEEEKTSQDREGDSCKERKVRIFGISDIPEILEKAFSKIDRTLSRVWQFLDEMVQERDRVESEKRLFDGIVEPEEEEDIEDETYHERLARYKSETGLLEAIQTGKAKINGLPILFGSMEFGFMGGSMGSVVGEKVARLIERATSEFLPLIIVCASGGARMQEGIFSLMQMAKISGTLYYFRQRSNQKKKLLYISILASPTTGGVLASFGMLANLVLSEPQTSIAFAGARVIEAILHETVPEGSQEAEPLMEKGMLDGIIERKLLKYYVAFLFDFHNLYSFLYGNSDD